MYKRGRLFVVPILAVVFHAVCLIAAAGAAEYEIHPSLTLSETYDDNIFLTRTNKVTDYITQVIPSVTGTYKAPLWVWDIKYAYDYIYYARGKRGSDSIHSLYANGALSVLKERLFLKVNDALNRVSLNVARDFTKESLFVDQSDRNILTLNPYYVLRPAPSLSIPAGYIYENVWYRSGGAISKEDHTAYAEPTWELSRTTFVETGYRFTHENNRLADFDRNDLYAGVRHEYADESFVFARAGAVRLDYANNHLPSTSNLSWSGGINYKVRRSTVSFTTSRDYTEDPFGSVLKTTSYIAALNAAYSRTLLNMAAQLVDYNTSISRLSATRKYGASGTVSYDISERTKGTFDFTVEKVEEKDIRTYVRQYLFGLKFDYLLMKNATLSLAYRYTGSYSPKSAGDTYTGNRIILVLRKDF